MGYIGQAPANKAVKTADIEDSAITAAKIADGTVVAGELASDAVTTAKILNANVTTAKLAADAVDGTKLADDAVNSEHYTDASIDNAHIADGAVDTQEIADNAITLAKMASGTDGNIISYDASGNPVAVATGNSGQLLTSAGAGQPPTFTTVSGFDVTSITGATALGATPADTDEFILSDAGTLKRVDYSHMKGGENSPNFYAYVNASTTAFGSNSLTKVPYDTEWWDIGSCFDTSNNRFVAPADGKYYFFASVRWENNLNAKEISLAPYLDGNAFGWIQKSTAAYSTGWQTLWGHFTKDLSANQYIEIYARHSRAVNHNLGGGNTLNTTFGGFLLIE